MDALRLQRSVGSDRFLGLLSSSPPSSSPSFEFDEHDIFSTDTDPNPSLNHNFSPLNPNPSPHRFLSPLSPFRGDQRNFGILAALPEDSQPQNPKFLQRKPSISPASSPSASTSPRMIPSIPRPKAAMELAGRMNRHQSAPMNVPVVPGRFRRENDVDKKGGDDDEEDELMLPPHEIVDRAKGKGEPMTTFSVLEGVGRTLKGRDLRRVRNAVWHKTGFLDSN